MRDKLRYVPLTVWLARGRTMRVLLLHRLLPGVAARGVPSAPGRSPLWLAGLGDDFD